MPSRLCGLLQHVEWGPTTYTSDTMKRSLFTHDDRIRMKLITAVAAQLPREADAYAACGTPFGPDDHAYAI